MKTARDIVYLERRDPARNMARYYLLSIERDLFEGVLAVRRWGRIGSWGRTVSVPCPDHAIAAEMLAGIEASKRSRGYNEPGKI
jgi:predicted DNA-binding WGR domain protein